MRHFEIDNELTAVKIIISGDDIIILLSNGEFKKFSRFENKKLAQATKEQLENVEIICEGTGIHWNDLNEDLSVSGILDGRFG